jgi:hypothetical protein
VAEHLDIRLQDKQFYIDRLKDWYEIAKRTQ